MARTHVSTRIAPPLVLVLAGLALGTLAVRADPAGQWSPIFTSGWAPPTAYPWIVVDAPAGWMYVLRDTFQFGSQVLPPDTLYSLSLTTGAWAAPIPDTKYNGSRYGLHAASELHPLLDSAHHRLINLQSVPPEYGNPLATALVWDLTGTPGWNTLPLSGSPPVSRYRPGLVCDPARNRIWLAGGTDLVSPVFPDQKHSDLWALDLSNATWTQVSNGSGTCVLDPVAPMFLDTWGDRLLTPGGSTANSVSCPNYGPTHANWDMPLTTPYAWLPLSGEPPSPPTGWFVFDSNRGRMLAIDLTSGTVRSNSLGLDSAWTVLSVIGTPPPARQTAAVAFDSTGDRVLVFGGLSVGGTITYSDVWQLFFDHSTPVLVSMADASVQADGVHLDWLVQGVTGGTVSVERRASGGAWRPLATRAPDGLGHVRLLDPDVKPGGHYDYRLSWSEDGTPRTGGEVTIEIPAAPGLTITTLASSGDRITVRFSLPDDRPARIECFDALGRRVRALDLDGFGAGSHTLQLDPGHRLTAGVWWIRLEQAGARCGTRAVVFR